jgi:NADPH:quinone reductase-like Zn-dependent oxidoreductase
MGDQLVLAIKGAWSGTSRIAVRARSRPGELGDPGNLRVEEGPTPVSGPGEVVVRVRAAALNHRDVWIRRGQYAGIRLPAILGSDATGEVAAAGDAEGHAWLGREVVIDPSLGWGSDSRAQEGAFQLLGMPTEGTYAEFVRVPVANVYPKPSHLSIEELPRCRSRP